MEQVDPAGAEQRLDDGATLIDVREQHEWDAGHSERAQHLPLSQLQSRVDELDEDTSYVVTCRSGGRSSQAVQFLAAKGHDVVNLDGGMLAWESSGRDVVTSDGDEGTVIDP